MVSFEIIAKNCKGEPAILINENSVRTAVWHYNALPGLARQRKRKEVKTLLVLCAEGNPAGPAASAWISLGVCGFEKSMRFLTLTHLSCYVVIWRVKSLVRQPKRCVEFFEGNFTLHFLEGFQASVQASVQRRHSGKFPGER